MTIKDWLRLVLPNFEVFLAHSTCRACPVFWNIFEWSSRRDAVFWVTLCRVIDIAANDANVLFHNNCLLKSVCRWQVLCQDYVASLSSSHSLWDRITSLRSVFLCPTTGYLTPKQKHVLHSQDFFFRAPASFTRASSRRSTGLLWCDPDRIRTCDPQLRRLLLYPAELPDQSLSICAQIDSDLK